MKRRLKLLISILVRGCDLLRESLARLTGRPLPPRCTVVYYHTVPAALRERFARQLDAILSLAQPISTRPSAPLQPGKRYVCVTFDDGFISVKENAASELARRGIPWTIFVPSGCLGRKPDWLRQAHPAARHDRVMTAEELRVVAADPLVTVGSHTVNHVNLLEADPSRAAAELRESKTALEAVLEKPVESFSYPFGGRNAALDGLAREAGYTRLFSSEPALAFQTPDDFLCGRITVDPDIPDLEFRLKISGAYRWLARPKRDY